MNPQDLQDKKSPDMSNVTNTLSRRETHTEITDDHIDEGFEDFQDNDASSSSMAGTSSQP